MVLWDITDIARAAGKEPSTIEKWISQGKLGKPTETRPRRWEKAEVLKRLEEMTDARRVLSDEQVQIIRTRVAAGESQKSVAAVFGITSAHVSHIVNGKRRKS